MNAIPTPRILRSSLLAAVLLSGSLTHGALTHRYTFDNTNVLSGSVGAADIAGTADLTPTGAGGGTILLGFL